MIQDQMTQSQNNESDPEISITRSVHYNTITAENASCVAPESETIKNMISLFWNMIYDHQIQPFRT